MKNSRTKMDVETVKKALVVSRENHLDTAQSNVSQKILEEEEYLSVSVNILCKKGEGQYFWLIYLSI